MVCNQPHSRLPTRLHYSDLSRSIKINGQEPDRINPVDEAMWVPTNLNIRTRNAGTSRLTQGRLDSLPRFGTCEGPSSKVYLGKGHYGDP